VCILFLEHHNFSRWHVYFGNTTHHFRNDIMKCRSNMMSFRDNMTQTRNHRWQFRLHMSWNRNNWKDMVGDCFHKECIFEATWCSFETTLCKVRKNDTSNFWNNMQENGKEHKRKYPVFPTWQCVISEICNVVSKQHVKFWYHICSLETAIGPKSTLNNMPYFRHYIYQFRNHMCVFRFHAPKIEK